MSWNETDLARLTELAADARRIDASRRAYVAHLRQQECPWSVIAEALGVTKQAAQQRYRSTRTSTVDRPLPNGGCCSSQDAGGSCTCPDREQNIGW